MVSRFGITESGRKGARQLRAGRGAPRPPDRGGCVMPGIRVHRHSTGPEGALVNAYLIETDGGIVAVDGSLTVSDGRALRDRVISLGKPLLAVLVTHAHPDHYGGVVELVGTEDVPVDRDHRCRRCYSARRRAQGAD